MNTTWTRSTRCDTGTCLWARRHNGNVQIRDAAGATLTVPPAAWAGLVATVTGRPA